MSNTKHNKYKIQDDIVYIYFNNCNDYTIVNLDKWNEIPLIKELTWFKGVKGYADARVPKKYIDIFGKTNIRLHQLICPCKEGYEPDHLDRNPLNNLTNNLILKTHRENSHNQSVRKDNKSGYTGIYWCERLNKWKSGIRVNGKQIHLGYFPMLNEAIKTRKKAEKKYWQ